MKAPLLRVFDDVLAPREERIRVANAPNRERYARDPFAHLEDEHIWIPDLVTLEMVPFRPFEHQEEILRSWIDLDYLARTGRPRFRNVHEEKSRQMGVTWDLAYAVWWLLTYHDTWGLVVHLKLEEIDDGGSKSTVDSFFGKVRLIQEARRPPEGDGREPGDFYLPRRFAAPLSWRMNPSQIKNLSNSTFVTGEGATPNPGRGGRFPWCILDEAAFIPWGESVHAAVSRAIPEGRFYNSTPFGEDNMYARIRNTRPRGYTFLRHHWSQHPTYGLGKHIAGEHPDACLLCQGNVEGLAWDPANPVAHRYPGQLTSPWYDDAVEELTDEQVAGELDIDYAKSLSARVYPEFTEEVHVVKEGILFDPNLPLSFSFDYGMDSTAVGIFQESPYEMRMIGEFEQGDLVPEAVATGVRQVLRGLMHEAEHDPLQIERLTSVEATRGYLAVGDPAGEGRDLATGRPLVEHYRRAGFNIVSQRQAISTTINATKRILFGRPKPLRISGPHCPRTITHFKMNRWPTDREGRRKPGGVPLDDAHNHMMRGIAYLITHKFPPPTSTESLQEATEDTGKIDAGLSYDMDL